MTIPTSSPAGVEVLASEQGIWLIVREEVPWWAIWRRGRVAINLDRIGMIWVYQAMAKYMRRGVIDDKYDEMADDLRRCLSFLASNESWTSNESWSLNDSQLEQLAMMMNKKGWVKM